MRRSDKPKQIPTRRISYYAKVCAAHNRLEKVRYRVRGELLELLDEGAIPSESGPFILVKSFQRRIDAEQFTWRMFATELALRLGKALGKDEADTVRFAMHEIFAAELDAKRKDVPVLQAKPNPAYLGELRLKSIE